MSQRTTKLRAAREKLHAAAELLVQVRDLLAAANGGNVDASVDPGTFDALWAIRRCRDADGEPILDSATDVRDLLDLLIAKSVEQDKARA